jgi:hypothetical protein
MNKHQRKVARAAKKLRNKTKLPWAACKWAAKKRAIRDFIRICL